MKINVVSYATGRFLKSQKILEKECYRFGADKVFSYNFEDLSPEFKEKNKNDKKRERISKKQNPIKEINNVLDIQETKNDDEEWT